MESRKGFQGENGSFYLLWSKKKKECIWMCVLFFFKPLSPVYLSVRGSRISEFVYMYVCVCVEAKKKNNVRAWFWRSTVSTPRFSCCATRESKSKRRGGAWVEEREKGKGKEKNTRERERRVRDERDKAHASTLKLGSRKAAQPRVFSFLFHLVRRN